MRVPEWAVVVPVKRLAAAKTRLRGSVPGVPHARLVLALAQDTVRAALACPVVAEVLVVTDDPAASAAVGRLGARVVPDQPDAGLNAAIGYGAAVVARPGRGVAAVTADLPALRAGELSAALRAATSAAGRGFVPDASGAGTTLLAAPAEAGLDPRFGQDSAARHAASGARRLDGDWPTLRRDVDTAADLAEAAVLGLGPHTASVWDAGGVTVQRVGGTAGGNRGMQGTVSEFDPQTGAGSLLLDDGTPVAFGAAAFEASGLRLLRLGQRVQVERGTDGAVTRVTIPTMRG